jgi:hypothetical protein
MTFAAKIKEIEKTISEAKKQAKTAFSDELKELFVRHPEIKVIQWTQYIPSFNDGDACEFSIGEVIVSNYEDVSFDGEWEGDDPEPKDLDSYIRNKSVDAVTSFINSRSGEEVLEFAFGVNVAVKVTADGITIDDYDCGY